MNEKSVENFRARFEEMMDELQEELGVEIKLGTIRYDMRAGRAHGKLEIFESKDGKSKEQADFEANCYKYGLTPAHYGRVFVAGGESYRLYGLNPRAPRYPVQGENIRTGGTFKFPRIVLSRMTK